MTHTLYTIGYTGRKPQQLQALVQQVGGMIVDTRYSLQSRVVQWTGAGLRQLLGESYLHLRSLGNVNYKNGGPIHINKPEEGVPEVVKLLEQQPVILLCMCPEVDSCHRKVVADLVVAACGCEVVHIRPGQTLPGVQTDTSEAPSPLPSAPAAPLTLTSKLLPLNQQKLF